MPLIKLSDQSQLSLYSGIQNEILLNILFINRQCELLSRQKNNKDIDLELIIAAEKPRYVYIIDFDFEKKSVVK